LCRFYQIFDGLHQEFFVVNRDTAACCKIKQNTLLIVPNTKVKNQQNHELNGLFGMLKCVKNSQFYWKTSIFIFKPITYDQQLTRQP
ncbi:MAG TPA: hypothetical protein PLU02_14130, partial [Chitinophagales bacterium]|nr:hypothetical protein [Chitinophagales bacterium]